MGPNTACPTLDELALFRAGLLEDDRLVAISDHLDICSAGCRVRLDESDPLIGLLRQKPPEVPTSEAGYQRLESWAHSTSPQFHDAPRPQLRPADPDTTDIGRIGPYRARRILGEGATGVVYEALDIRLDRVVALKVLRPSQCRDSASRQRFLREAQLVAELVDDHIVTVHDVGEDNGNPYIAMALVRGQSLEERLRRHPRPLVAEIVDLARQILQGLAVAHEHDLVHRDVKPANIWIEEVPVSASAPHGLRVKLLDFGLAHRTADTVRLTQTGMVLGTPAYMAPEAAGGVSDERSDLFSVGCILYRMTTGTLPFTGPDPLSIVYSLANVHPAPPHRLNPAIPPWLSAIVMKLLAKKNTLRFATAKSVIAALDTPPQRTIWYPLALVTTLSAITLGVMLWPKTPQVPEEQPPIAPVVREGPAKPEPGMYYRIKNVWSNKVLAVDENRRENGAAIVQMVGGPSIRQHWTFVKIGAFFKIINRHSGKAITVQNGSKEEGAAIVQWDAEDDAEHQQWSIEASGQSLFFRARHTKQVLEVADASRGRRVPLVQGQFTNGAGQIFELIVPRK